MLAVVLLTSLYYALAVLGGIGMAWAGHKYRFTLHKLFPGRRTQDVRVIEVANDALDVFEARIDQLKEELAAKDKELDAMRAQVKELRALAMQSEDFKSLMEAWSKYHQKYVAECPDCNDKPA